MDGGKTFDRAWAEYKNGFRDTAGNYWLGNDHLNMLTRSRGYKIRFEVNARSDKNASLCFALATFFHSLSDIAFNSFDKVTRLSGTS